MRLLINIPKEFEQHFQADRFEDSLHRLSVDAHLLAGDYEQETAVMLIESFKSAIHVPAHGRLVDANEMFYYFVIEGQRSKRYKLGEKWELNGEEIRKVIGELPTVIPANEEET